MVGALSLCFADSQALLSPSNRQDFVKLVMQGPKPRLRTSKKHQQLESSINCLLLEPGWCPQRCQMCLPLLGDTNCDIELKGTDRCSGKSQLITGESQMKIGLTLLSFMLCECTRILCLAKKEAIRRECSDTGSAFHSDICQRTADLFFCLQRNQFSPKPPDTTHRRIK